MKRSIIKIDQDRCTGCGLCIPNCPEGAIQIIDGKARLISDLLCDGLGACLGHCPEGAIEIEQREAQEYDEYTVMESIAAQGANTIKAHLNHLRDHQQLDYLATAKKYLGDHAIPLPEEYLPGDQNHGHGKSGCPGSANRTFTQKQAVPVESPRQQSHLTHWPVQLHLISPMAPQYKGSDLLLAADCTAFAAGNFHTDYLRGKTLIIACPKLDTNKEVYRDKLIALIDQAQINTLTVMIMEVPCCSGLLRIAREAAGTAKRKVPIQCITIGLQGDQLSKEWV